MTSEETQSAPGTTSKSDIQPPTAITPVAEGQRISNILQENSLLLVLSPQKSSSSPHPSTPEDKPAADEPPPGVLRPLADGRKSLPALVLTQSICK